jgi:predicted RNA binding protein YcfA (HicA-like mRNA interferase family)
MPKLPVCKDRDLIRVLKKLGFFAHAQRGTSHLIFVHVDGRRTTVPIHRGKDIPRGTLRGILRDINVSPAQFGTLLKNR